MTDLKPTFSLTVGALRTTTTGAAGGPERFVVERDMDAAADGLQARLSDRSDVALGDSVDLALGHDGNEDPVFTGTVVSVRPLVDGADIWALGGLHELTRLTVGAEFEGQTAGAIARDLCGRAGVTPGTVDEGPLLPRYVADPRLTAHAHLRALADRLGFELYADVSGAAMFHDPAGPFAAIGGESYAYGEHLLAVGGRREPPAWEAIDVGGESPVSGEGDRTLAWLTAEDANYRGSAGSGASLLIVDPAARTKDLADRFAEGWVTVAARTAAELRATVLGRPALDLGSAVSLSGAPDSLSDGGGYVRALRHRFGADAGFVTDLRVAVAP